MPVNATDAPKVDERFVMLVRQYQRSVFAVILGYVHCREDARDLTQETFLRAFRSLDTVRDPAKIPGWIGAIARNVALDHLKRAGRRCSLMENMDILEEPSPQFPDKEIDAMLAAIEKLEEIYRIPLLLKYMEAKPVKEIADLLGIPETTVEGRLAQARIQLRKMLVKPGGIQ